MKPIYLALLFFSLVVNTLATPVIRATANGRWGQASTWNANRQPQSGDTVLIPANIEVVLDYNETLNNIVLKITGTLKLLTGKLNLDVISRIDIDIPGRLSGNGNDDQVAIGGTFKFRGGVDQSILGPAYSDNTTGSSPHGFNSAVVLLKATLTNFAISKVNEQVYIRWESVPGNTIRFEIEKSLNGDSWAIMEAIPVTGDPNQSRQYLFTDKARGAAYYRVKQVFAAGTSYTAVKAVNINGKGIYISSAPAQIVRVRSNEAISFPVRVTVMDMNGSIVQQVNYETPVPSMDFRVRGLNNSRYVVYVKDAAGAERRAVVVL